MIYIRATKDIETVRKLHKQTFPSDEFYEHKKNKYWIAYDDGRPIGFGIATDYGHNILFLSRAGVISKYRGRGIHKRLINVRLRFAKRNRFKSVITYTAKSNLSSINNIIARGFKIYEPAEPWVGTSFLYWLLTL